MLLGLRTALYPAPDLAKGKAFWTEVLGVEPFFGQPFFGGYSVGGFELGLVPDAKPGDLGAVAYWGVADCAAELARIASLGATVLEPVTDVGEGIKVAAVADPFGNRLGLIENPHFDPKTAR